MSEKKVRKKYFIAKKPRFLITLIALLSIFFIYLAKEVTESREHGMLFGFLLLVFIMLSILAFVVILIVLFSHRLLGPFGRLEKEMKQIQAGNYHRRFQLRKGDDQHLKSFISKLNNMMDEFEKIHFPAKEPLEEVYTELSKVISTIESGEVLKEKQSEVISSLHKKVRFMLEEMKK